MAARPRPTGLGCLYCRPASVLLLLLRLAFGGPQVVPHLCVHEGPSEDKQGAQPVPQGERVLEVQDGEDEADELAQRHDEGDGEGGTFCGDDEDAPDAHVPGGAGLRRFSVNSPEISGRTSWPGAWLQRSHPRNQKTGRQPRLPRGSSLGEHPAEFLSCHTICGS